MFNLSVKKATTSLNLIESNSNDDTNDNNEKDAKDDDDDSDRWILVTDEEKDEEEEDDDRDKTLGDETLDQTELISDLVLNDLWKNNLNLS